MLPLAYIAGFFDGEGCISFSKCKDAIFPRVLLVNTNRAILEDIQNQFGGDINPLALRKANWKQGWEWRLGWSRAVDFLEKISPYLRIKDRQACTVFAWDTVRPGRGRKWDTETLSLLAERMTWLNKKGPIETDDPVDIAVNDIYSALVG